MVLRATDFNSKGKVLERKKGIFEFQKHGFKYQKVKPEGSEHRFYIVNQNVPRNCLFLGPQTDKVSAKSEEQSSKENGIWFQF